MECSRITLQMRASDVVLGRPSLIIVFERLGIPLGFQDQSLHALALGRGINPGLLLNILHLTMGVPYISVGEYGHRDVGVLVDFLLQSHDFYSQEALPRLQGLLGELSASVGGGGASALVSDFLGEYTREVEVHFAYERDTVFPYVRRLLQVLDECGDAGGLGYSVEDYRDQHENIADKLEDLQCLLVKHLTFDGCYRIVRDLYLSIASLGADIASHTRIENDLLVPLVRRLERVGAKGVRGR